MALIFHYRDDGNFLTRLNPNAKLLCLLLYSIVISGASTHTVLFLAFFPFLLAFLIRLPFLEYLKESLFFIFISICMFISSYLNGKGILASSSAMLSFLSMVLASMLLTDTTMPDDLARSLGSALSHLLGRGAYTVAALVEVTLSMIPLIIDSTAGLYTARRARGASFVLHPFKSITEYSISVITDLLDKAEAYTDALYARGYDASKKRYVPPYHVYDWIVILSAIILTALYYICKMVLY